MRGKTCWLGLCAGAVLLTGAARASRVEVCPQVFDAGGWKIDVQFMDVMGSPYLLAHGCGIRVTDAKARVNIPVRGTWRVWVRSRKWVDGAGAFGVEVGGRPLARTFGVSQSEWAWEDGGTVDLDAGETELRLIDHDGFDGRCAGVVLLDDGTRPEGALGTEGITADEVGSYDLIVVGGGLPGTCAAVAAARRGLKVALVQDRPVLGGNASAEVRVWSAGEARYPLVRELRGWFQNRDANALLSDAHRMRVVEDERTLSTFLCSRVFAAEKSGDRITAVRALDWKRNRVIRLEAPFFCDATGDGWLGFYAGAEWRMGREAKDEYGESFAPARSDGDTLGASLMWTSAEANARVAFDAPWAEKWAQGETAVCGAWNWEYGIHQDVIRDGEWIRDRLLLAVYGAFSRAKKDEANARRVLDCVPFILGKRESRRLLGDWIYSEKDVVGKRLFEDAVASGSWSVDLHYDTCKEGVDFLTVCRQPHYGRYWIPYRSIYSRNIGNLFVVGRCFSCTHVGLGGPRVMNTLGQLGCAAGEAAALCKRYGILPRGVYADGHCRELQRILGGDFPGNPDPETKDWLIVDDEDETVSFGKGWLPQHNPNGEQVGEISHMPSESGWSVDLAPNSDIGDVVYPLPVKSAGRYRLMGRIPYMNRARSGSQTAFELVSGTAVAPFTVDQSVDSGLWRNLGTFDIQPNATLRIRGSRSHGTVVADGFALVPVADGRLESIDLDNTGGNR